MTSASAREHGASLALGFRIAALQQTVYLSEARVFNYASTNKHFLRGFEGGINDCGLYVGDQTLSDGTQTDKMFELDKLYRTSHEKPVLPIEIKTISPKGNGNANMAWSLSFSRKQYDTCQAVLVNTVKEPDLIALIPMHYIRQRIGNPAEDGDKIADFIRPLWTIHPAQAYPPEMAPFILPIAMLGRALESMRDYAVGATKQWVNEHTGVRFNVPVPARHASTILRPDFLHWQNALDMVARVYKAFKYTQNFRVEFVDLFPISGDMKLVYNTTGTEILVEVKKDHCDFALGEELEPSQRYMKHGQDVRGLRDRQVFSWKAPWDYIYTVQGRGKRREEALFIPRDMIPQSWWNNTPLGTEDFDLDWPADDIETVRQYVVDLRSPNSIAMDIERIIILTLDQTNSMKAQNDITIEKIHIQLLSEPQVAERHSMIDDPGGFDPAQELNTTQCWSSLGYHRGFGSQLHGQCRGEVYEAWSAEVLTQVFRNSGKGLVIDLGRRNTMCRFCVARYTWSPADKRHYDRYGDPPYARGLLVHKRTPVVRVSFVRFAWGLEDHPQASRHALWAQQTMAERSPTLVIADMFPSGCIRMPHSRFILPFSEIPEDLSRCKPIRLQGMWDQYHVEEDRLADVITSIVDNNQAQTLLGMGQTVVQNKDYCCFLETAMSHGVTD